MRKRTRRRIVLPMPPPGLRPRLAADQVRDLGVAHWINLDTLARGQGDEDLLWQFVGGVLTWSRVADLLATRNADYTPAVDEMRAQLELATRLVERYGAKGRVLFTGVDYQVAKRGAIVMDALAAVVDRPTAVAAAEWSEAKVNAMAAARAARPVFPTAPSITGADIPY